MELLFWSSCLLIFYAYAGYPAALAMVGRFHHRGTVPGEEYRPSVSIVLPVYNEEAVVGEKLENLLELEDPGGGVEILVISDCSTDSTHGIVEHFRETGVQLHILDRRLGKGAGLNLGVEKAGNEVIVFTDASIMLEKDALVKILEPMKDPKVGCVSGEDRIEGGGEGAYGRYELYLRNLESRVSSIVGASGCFYAQRRDLVRPFLEGMAPDFLSVLVTVESGFRAVTQPSARGRMKSVGAGGGEFHRKVRTVLRGMTTLFHFRKLLNPFRYGLFSWELFSHKILRWLVGPWMVLALVSSLAMASSPLYLWLSAGQLMFYLLALLGWKGPRILAEKMPSRLAFFFCMANYAALIAWVRWVRGERQEIWEPSKR